jgi:hypothetical protein
MSLESNNTGMTRPSLALPICLGVTAVLVCGIPFVPPLVFVAVPLAVISLVLVVRAMWRAEYRTKGRLVSAAIAVGIDLFALYLALGHHHLIDWLEGH